MNCLSCWPGIHFILCKLGDNGVVWKILDGRGLSRCGRYRRAAIVAEARQADAGAPARARRGRALGGVARGHGGRRGRDGVRHRAGGHRAAATLQEFVGRRRRREAAAEETSLLASRTQVA